MANKKKYRIYCNTCVGAKEGWSNLDDPPTQCPVNAGHSVNSASKAVVEILALDNLVATTDPTVSDDINDGYAVGSRWLNTVTNTSFVCSSNADGSAVWNRQLTGVFGTQYNYAESLGESSSTSETFQDKAVITTALPAGTYRVGWYCGVCTANQSKNYEVRASLNDSTVLGSQGNYNPQYMGFSGFANVTLTAATHTFCIEWRTQTGGTAAYIRNARLELWRIS